MRVEHNGHGREMRFKVWEVLVGLIVTAIIGITTGAWGSTLVLARLDERVARNTETISLNTIAIATNNKALIDTREATREEMKVLAVEIGYLKGALNILLDHYNLPRPQGE